LLILRRGSKKYRFFGVRHVRMDKRSSKTAEKQLKTVRFPVTFFKWVFTAPGQQKLSIVWGSPGEN
jgi:hypothetical protein